MDPTAVLPLSCACLKPSHHLRFDEKVNQEDINEACRLATLSASMDKP